MSDEPIAAPGKPAEPAAEPVAKVVPVDPLTLSLAGEAIPEKFRGKTVADILKSYSEAETALNEKSTLVSDWEKWYMKNHPAEPAAGVEPEELPFDQKQISVLSDLLAKQLTPITQALDNVFLNNIKEVVPDFGSFEKRATEIYNQMPPQFKYGPKHGWAFAYNMAKSEMIGLPKAGAPPGISAGGPTPPPKTESDLSEEELSWAKKQGLTPEEYKKFQTPREPV